jgi:hypothetical protein
LGRWLFLHSFPTNKFFNSFVIDADGAQTPENGFSKAPSVLNITIDKKEIAKHDEEGDQLDNTKAKKQKIKKQPSVSTPRLTKEEKELVLQTYKAHLLALVGSFRLASADCDDSLLQALLLSILPSMHVPVKKHINDDDSFMKWLTAVTVWWSGSFTLVETVLSFAPFVLLQLLIHCLVASGFGFAEIFG